MPTTYSCTVLDILCLKSFRNNTGNTPVNILNKCNAKPLRGSVEESDDTQIRERGTLLGFRGKSGLRRGDDA